ncbi:hypothetical protein SAGO17_0017 [Mimivirus AB-566-O17]|uniref:Uncharacterized protein n=1 Tax=Mimivirus AB-566-O17 TaxID=1988039 RepID=A0A1X9VNP5_9VIRU|nr:hypothetical protein SAGO17_0017 [Mimivirus AB-566-O17]
MDPCSSITTESHTTANNINNLLMSEFNNNNVTIYGTWEEPLFKAKDIGDMLGIEKITKTMSSFDDTKKNLVSAPSGIISEVSPSGGGLQSGIVHSPEGEAGFKISIF